MFVAYFGIECAKVWLARAFGSHNPEFSKYETVATIVRMLFLFLLLFFLYSFVRFTKGKRKEIVKTYGKLAHEQTIRKIKITRLKNASRNFGNTSYFIRIDSEKKEMREKSMQALRRTAHYFIVSNSKVLLNVDIVYFIHSVFFSRLLLPLLLLRSIQSTNDCDV